MCNRQKKKEQTAGQPKKYEKLWSEDHGLFIKIGYPSVKAWFHVFFRGWERIPGRAGPDFLLTSWGKRAKIKLIIRGEIK